VSDERFLLHGSHRKSSVNVPPGVDEMPPEAARDGDVIKVWNDWNFFLVKFFLFIYFLPIFLKRINLKWQSKNMKNFVCCG